MDIQADTDHNLHVSAFLSGLSSTTNHGGSARRRGLRNSMTESKASITPARLRLYDRGVNTKRYITRLITMGALLLAGWSSRAADTSVAPATIGHWEGDARIIVSWCHQTNLHVTIDIRPDGSVTGKVGDATLIKGRFERNRGWLGRKLDLATDHIIRGELNGPVVAAEGITRESVSIPLNFTGGAFVGGVHTSGSKFGGKEKMILSASSLTLRHSK